MKCKVCGSSENIHRHHISYNPEEKIIPLCARHHSQWHSVKPYGMKVEEAVSLLRSKDDWLYNISYPEVPSNEGFDFSGLEYAITGKRPIHPRVWRGIEIGDAGVLNPNQDEHYQILRSISRLVESLSDEEMQEYLKMKETFSRILSRGLVESLCFAVYKGKGKRALLSIGNKEPD